jgi:antitoxin MazE
MISSIKKWGNSASVRIPAAVMAAAHLSLDQAVEVREEGGRVVIEPVRPREFSLDALVNAITDENRHAAVETGRPMGREAW